MDRKQTQYLHIPKSKWKMLTNYFKNPKSECPDIWIRPPRHKWPKSRSNIEDPGLFLSVYMDDIKLAGKKQNIDPMWKVRNKEVDLGEPTSFLDHVYLVCTQRQCEINKDIVDNDRTMFESRIAAGGVEKLPFPQICVFLRGHMTWLVMQRSVWNDIVSWQTRRLNNSTKYLLHALMTTTSKKRKQNLLENCQIHALKIVLKCLYLARIGRPDILWSVNKLARSITKWTKACDKRLNRLISYIHHTCGF